MSKSIEASPQQHRLLRMAYLAGMKGIRSSDAIAGEMALLVPDQRTQSRKRIITANVCHALRKLCKRGVMVAFRAPNEGLRYVSVAVLRAEDAIRNTPAFGQTCEIMIVDEVQPAELIGRQPIEQHTAVESHPSPLTPEDFLEVIRRGCAAAAEAAKSRG